MIFMILRTTGLILLYLSLSAVVLSASSFRVMGLSQIKGMERLELVTADGVVVVPVSISSLSEAFDIPSSGRLDFYIQAPKNDEDVEPVLSVSLTDISTDVILLLRADLSMVQPTYKYVTIENSPRMFPAGSVMLFNLTSKTIAAKMGEDSVRLGSGEKTVVNLINRNEPFDGGVMFAAEFNGFGKVFSTSSWYLVPSMKIFCIIYSDLNGNPQIRRIRLS
jgi:hypothetical protein